MGARPEPSPAPYPNGRGGSAPGLHADVGTDVQATLAPNFGPVPRLPPPACDLKQKTAESRCRIFAAWQASSVGVLSLWLWTRWGGRAAAQPERACRSPRGSCGPTHRPAGTRPLSCALAPGRRACAAHTPSRAPTVWSQGGPQGRRRSYWAFRPWSNPYDASRGTRRPSRRLMWVAR